MIYKISRFVDTAKGRVEQGLMVNDGFVAFTDERSEAYRWYEWELTECINQNGLSSTLERTDDVVSKYGECITINIVIIDPSKDTTSWIEQSSVRFYNNINN